jgi:G3E family GTPase
VSSADLLLLNKVDLIPHESLESLEAVLHRMAPDTPVVRSIHGQVDPSILFPPDLQGLRARRRSAGAQPTPHLHESFIAYELAVEDGIAPQVLTERLQQLGMLRGKGFVRTSDGIRLAQGVGRRVELNEPPTPPPAALVGRVVIIVRDPGGGASLNTADRGGSD